MLSRKIALAAVVLLAALMISAVLLAKHTPAAAPYQGAGKAVGALVVLRNGVARRAACTATVVSSRAGNLLITAAHCLGTIPLKALAFIPDYRGPSGHYPYGMWHVTAQRFPPGWYPGGNINRDFAFLTVKGDVQARVGAETLGSSSPVPASVQVIGYGMDGKSLIACTTRPATITAAGQRQLKFTCGKYSDAASGAPFLVHVNAKTGHGTLVGVIGGYHQGGNRPTVSYSSPFGATLEAFYTTVAGLSWAQRADGDE
jgi:V8-like Glu-specific endopeptidase